MTLPKYNASGNKEWKICSFLKRGICEIILKNLHIKLAKNLTFIKSQKSGLHAWGIIYLTLNEHIKN